jgi:hypothetical protein
VTWVVRVKCEKVTESVCVRVYVCDRQREGGGKSENSRERERGRWLEQDGKSNRDDSDK